MLRGSSVSKVLYAVASLFSFVVLLSASSAYAETKVEVCHIPPGNPDNFHTITISENALSAHLAHGDLGGACDDVCATLCDDGDACTIDDTGDCEQNGCPATRVSVNCDDGNECTADSCAPGSGCVNTARTGEACDDGAVCTGPDACDAGGVCGGSVISNCCESDGDCGVDLCSRTSCDIGTNRCAENPVVCTAPDLCTVSMCAPDTGECVDTPVACGDGECSLDTGTCVPTTCDTERFVNLGLTVFDCDTDLEWEKKTQDGSVHDVARQYTWSTCPVFPCPFSFNGTAKTDLLDPLNTPPCFAGHCDWRMPPVGELTSIVDCSFGSPCIAPVFGPTSPTFHWSATGGSTNSTAQGCNFSNGVCGAGAADSKQNPHVTRAVRGGP